MILEGQVRDLNSLADAFQIPNRNVVLSCFRVPPRLRVFPFHTPSGLGESPLWRLWSLWCEGVGLRYT